eukprot:COSAG05_NODE_2670_length_2780_cov_1.848191_1_plen_104_part_10
MSNFRACAAIAHSSAPASEGGTLCAVPTSAFEPGLCAGFATDTDRGAKTCAGRPAALGHEQTDADTYVEWGADYLKEDSCDAPQDHAAATAQYAKMRDALNISG